MGGYFHGVTIFEGWPFSGDNHFRGVTIINGWPFSRDGCFEESCCNYDALVNCDDGLSDSQ